MESWRHSWRYGFEPAISLPALNKLKTMLESDDPRLVQGATTQPPAMQCVYDWPIEAACAIGVCGWQHDNQPVGEVSQAFAELCAKADHNLGQSAAGRFFLQWFDDTPRAEMREELLAEVEWAIYKRTRYAQLAAMAT